VDIFTPIEISTAESQGTAARLQVMVTGGLREAVGFVKKH